MAHLDWPVKSKNKTTKTVQPDGSGRKRSHNPLRRVRDIHCTCCRKPRSCCRCDHVEPLVTWLRLVGIFFLNAIIAIPDTTFGLFYNPLMELFDATRAQIGWTYSILVTTSMLTGMFASPFIDLYGCKPVSMFGAALVTIGMTLAPFSPNLVCFYIFYGLISGVGWGICWLAGMTVIQQIFTHNRGLATGLVAFGFTLGTVVSPKIIEMFLETYAIRGALLMKAALAAQSLVLATAMDTGKKSENESTSNLSFLEDVCIMSSQDDFSPSHQAMEYSNLRPVSNYMDNIKNWPVAATMEEALLQQVNHSPQNYRTTISTPRPNDQEENVYPSKEDDQSIPEQDRRSSSETDSIRERNAQADGNQSDESISSKLSIKQDENSFESRQNELNQGTIRNNSVHESTGDSDTRLHTDADEVNHDLVPHDASGDVQVQTTYKDITTPCTEDPNCSGESRKDTAVESKDETSTRSILQDEDFPESLRHISERASAEKLNTISHRSISSSSIDRDMSSASRHNSGDSINIHEQGNLSNHNPENNDDSESQHMLPANTECNIEKPTTSGEHKTGNNCDTSSNDSDLNVNTVSDNMISKANSGSEHQELKQAAESSSCELHEDGSLDTSTLKVENKGSSSHGVDKTGIVDEETPKDCDVEKSNSINEIIETKTIMQAEDQQFNDDIANTLKHQESKPNQHEDVDLQEKETDEDTELSTDGKHMEKNVPDSVNQDESELAQTETLLTEKDQAQAILMSVDDLSKASSPSKTQKLARELFHNFRDFSLYKSPLFTLFVACNFLMIVARMSIVTHFPSAAQKRGATSDEAATFLTVMGLSNFTLRALSTIILNLRRMNYVAYYTVGIVFLTAAGIIAIVASTYETMVASMVLLGACEGISNTVFPLVISHIAGVDRFAKAMGLLNAAILVTPFIAAPLSGWFVDITGEYVITFVLGSTCAALSAIFGSTIVVYEAVRRRRRRGSSKEIPGSMNNLESQPTA